MTMWIRRATAAVVVAGAVASGAVIAQAKSAPKDAKAGPGGLVVGVAAGGTGGKHAVIQATLPVDGTTPVQVTNNSTQTLKIAVAARPWTQSSATAAIAAKRSGSLAGVTPSETAFTLAPGQVENLTLALHSSAVTYGALEVTGLPANAAKRKGVTLGYRILTPIRLLPKTPTEKLTVGKPKLRGKGSARVISVAIHNGGDSIAPIVANAAIKSGLGTRRPGIDAFSLLPGKTVNLTLAKASTLAKGRYSVSVSAKQDKVGKTAKATIKIAH